MSPMSCREAADLQHAFGLCCEARVKLEALAGAGGMGDTMGDPDREGRKSRVGYSRIYVCIYIIIQYINMDVDLAIFRLDLLNLDRFLSDIRVVSLEYTKKWFPYLLASPCCRIAIHTGQANLVADAEQLIQQVPLSFTRGRVSGLVADPSLP